MLIRIFACLSLVSVIATAACVRLPGSPQSRCTSDEALDTVARTLLHRSVVPANFPEASRHLIPELEDDLVAFLGAEISRITLRMHDASVDRTVCAGVIFDQTVQFSVAPTLDRPGWVYEVETNPDLDFQVANAVLSRFDRLQSERGGAASPTATSRAPREQMSSPDGASQTHQAPPSGFPYYHNGPDASVLSLQGFGSNNVTLTAQVTQADIDDWCGRHDQPEPCFPDSLTNEFRIEADCGAGRMEWSPGNQFHQVIGRDQWGYVFEDVEGRLYASFNADAAAMFDILCPDAVWADLPYLAE